MSAPVYIGVRELPEALARRGLKVTARQAQTYATSRKLPFFASPLDGRLVITDELIDKALSAPAEIAEREWNSRRQARAASRSR